MAATGNTDHTDQNGFSRIFLVVVVFWAGYQTTMIQNTDPLICPDMNQSGNLHYGMDPSSDFTHRVPNYLNISGV